MMTYPETLEAALNHIARELEYAHGGHGQMPTLDAHIYESAKKALAAKPMPEAELAVTQLRNSTRRIEAQLARVTRENLLLSLKQTTQVLGWAFNKGADPEPVARALSNARIVIEAAEKAYVNAPSERELREWKVEA